MNRPTRDTKKPAAAKPEAASYRVVAKMPGKTADPEIEAVVDLLMQGKVVAMEARDRSTANSVQGKLRTRMRQQDMGLATVYKLDEQYLYVKKAPMPKKVRPAASRTANFPSSGFEREMTDALVKLGFKRIEASQAVRAAISKVGPGNREEVLAIAIKEIPGPHR